MDATGGRTRRAVLAAAGSGAVALAGYGVVGRSGPATASVLAAGSLGRALRERLAPRVSPDLEVEAHGSATVARLVAAGRRDPDLVALADPALFDGPMEADWHARFASNEVVLAYDDATDGGRRVASADRWFDPLLDDAVALGRTDPDQDPLGYRTLFALTLAGRRRGIPDLRERVTAPEQVYPETGLLARLEAGAVEAAFAYRSMALDHGLPFVELPAAVDLGDPAHRESYRTVSYDLPGGRTVRGEVIAYGAVARTLTEPALAVFRELVAGDSLREAGFRVPDAYPRYEGAVPDGVR